MMIIRKKLRNAKKPCLIGKLGNTIDTGLVKVNENLMPCLAYTGSYIAKYMASYSVQLYASLTDNINMKCHR